MMDFFLQRQKPAAFDEKANTGLQQRKKRPEGVSMAEVARHNKRDDCWMVIENNVYDVTSWVSKHPGGDVLLSYAGLDATDVFDAFHADATYKMLPNYCIGQVTDLKISDSLMQHRKLRTILKQEKFYESSKLFYVYKILTNLSLLSLSVFLLSLSCSDVSPSTFWATRSGSVLFMALFWQQCGWLAHDFLHHQVFQSRQANNFMGYMIGNVFQGFSVAWWKGKHNLHHATPNVAGFDPDIDTLPFLAWSEQLIEGELQGLPKFLIKFQYIFYVPLLAAARLSWLIQSWLHANSNKANNNRVVEVSTLLLHYLWVGAIAFGYLGFTSGLLYLTAAQACTGLLLASAFSLNHNGMSILDTGSRGDMEFNRLQVVTARDVNPGPFGIVHWFMGGLDMQIEHHLYPGIPRHNLPRLQKRIEALCKEHGIDYHKTGFVDGTKELYERLYSVSGNI